ncbi:MAG TPA: hypothetical protein VKI65_15690, partial [Gemmataceae bacterium]|nr:hypothetical protein [Gemmataceae bacterium]
MAKDGRLIFVGAGALGLAGLLVCSPSLGADKQDTAVTASLAVQTALQQGRESLVRGDAKAAVYVLESQLSRINGNGTYLGLLRDAYRAHVKQLRLANQEDEAQVYLKRLQILDPGASLDRTITQRSNPPPPPPSSEKSAGRPGPKVVRGSMAEEDPQARLIRTSKSLQARGLVTRAEEEFRNHHYREAWLLFEQAHETDPDALSASRERWAYCKLHQVFDEVKQPAAGQSAWTKLEREARLAMNLAPRLEQYGNVVLAEIEKQRGSRATEDAGIRDGRSGVSIQHFERGAERWARAETVNFRIFHNQSREMAEQVARVAETTRTAMYRKWFGNAEPDWNPKCDLYLHASARDYGQAT